VIQQIRPRSRGSLKWIEPGSGFCIRGGVGDLFRAERLIGAVAEEGLLKAFLVRIRPTNTRRGGERAAGPMSSSWDKGW
jgi:hypothetical protein